MIKFIHNIGEYFSSNYFDEDFAKTVFDKTGYAQEDLKFFRKRISGIKDKYFRYKQQLIDGKLRVKDVITDTHHFHTEVLNALGYPGDHPEYKSGLFHIDETTVLPIRHTLYRGDRPHLMIMEMQPFLKEGDEDPDGLFEQRYHVEEEEVQSPPQKYHRSQWSNVFKVADGQKISPMVINKAVSELFLLDQHRRPKFILLCAGNRYFLLEQEKWFRGSYLEFDLEELFDDAAIKKDYYSLFYTLLAKETLAPKSEIVLMEQLEEDSHKSAYEVTKDLKEGVIHAVEALANETVHYWKKEGKDLEEIDADTLKNECLNYVYRLLFLFYAESRNDLDILPADDPVYQHGYSLEMLREMEQVPLNTATSRDGDFFHKSLQQLFLLLGKGYREKEDGLNRSFKVRHLDSPLFDDDKLEILPKVKIRNVIWQEVILQLSLSRQKKGKQRGRISYANLGINQLGSVYESLLAFRGFFAETDYIEVHRKPKKKNETSRKIAKDDGSYLVPRHRFDDFHQDEIYREPDGEPRIIRKGTFVYRLSGRDRQKSASYYTPESLTQTTVKYTLKPILERLDKKEMKALDLLELKILEPAMGAAAFHNEVINQLAEAYLQYRQEEKKQKVAPDKYREELQKIKAYIALNNVYGVDLNPTAVELGKLSLWLNVIHKDMQTPFFGYRLGVGNAVVGAWLKVFKSKDFLFDPNDKRAKKNWWEKVPKHLQFGITKILRKQKEIYHFLLPDANMVPSAGIKLLKTEFPDESKYVTEWKKDFCAPIRGNEFERLQKISKAIDYLLEEHYLIQSSINRETQVKEEFFGAYEVDEQVQLNAKSYDEKERLAKQRNQTNAPYYKLKLVMDYWCSLWFWDVRNARDLPSRTEWYDDIENILNIDFAELDQKSDDPRDPKPTGAQQRLFGEDASDPALKNYKKDKTFVQASMMALLKERPTSLFTNRRSEIVNELAERHRYFHYQLEFVEVFKERGGFDVAVGNPPWLKITFELKEVFGDYEPLILIRNYSAASIDSKEIFEKHPATIPVFYSELIDTTNFSTFFSSNQLYAELAGQQSDLYKLITLNSLNLLSNKGLAGIVQPQTIFEDSKGAKMRSFIYPKLRFLFQFRNELDLFPIGHTRQYCISVFEGERRKASIDFLVINNLFHPLTIDESFKSDERNPMNVPGLKEIKEEGKNFSWNIRGHHMRIIRMTDDLIRILQGLEDTPDMPKLLSFHSELDVHILVKLFEEKSVKNSVSDYFITEGFHETNQVKKGNLVACIEQTVSTGSLDEHIFVGPEIHIATPFYRSPNKVVKNHHNYSNYHYTPQLEFQYPRSLFFLNKNKQSTLEVNWMKREKLGFNKMLDSGVERTIQPAILPAGTGHTGSLISISFVERNNLLALSSLTSSIIFDFFIKVTKKANLSSGAIQNFPMPNPSTGIIEYTNKIIDDLNRIPNSPSISNFLWSNEKSKVLSNKGLSMSNSFYLRRQGLLELDVLICRYYGLTLKELISIYDVYFPITQQYDLDTWYDLSGNIVFTNNSQGLKGVGVDRSVWNSIKDLKAGETYEHTIEKSELYQGKKVTYYAPFDKCDRVEDYKVAWAHFERIFQEETKEKVG